MKLLAALYVTIVLTWLGFWVIPKMDKYAWKGVLFGILFCVGWGLFMLSVMILSGEQITWH